MSQPTIEQIKRMQRLMDEQCIKATGAWFPDGRGGMVHMTADEHLTRTIADAKIRHIGRGPKPRNPRRPRKRHDQSHPLYPADEKPHRWYLTSAEYVP